MSEYLVDPRILSPEACHTRECEKKQAKNFFSLESLPFFFKSLCFQQLLRCYRINAVTSWVIVKKLCWPEKGVKWGLSHSRMRQKIGQNLFFTGTFAFFFKKLFFQQLLWCYRINTVTSTVNVKRPCGPSYTVPWGLSHSIMLEKTGQKLFSL